MPRIRLSIWRLMLAVAVLGIVFGAERLMFVYLAAKHSAGAQSFWPVMVFELCFINLCAVFILNLLYGAWIGDKRK